VYRARRFDCAVVAFDEPSSALDEHTERAVIGALRALADDGRAVLVVSHRRAVIESADHEVVLGMTSAAAAATQTPVARAASTASKSTESRTDTPVVRS
jgi:ATP-binding cassette subfamily C protein CydD